MDYRTEEQFINEVDLTQEAKGKTLEEFIKAQGTPVYHGTRQKFGEFKWGVAVGDGGDLLGKGFYFTSDKNMAREFGHNVMERYVILKNPLRIAQKDLIVEMAKYDDIKKELQEKGYDGIVVAERKFGGGTKYPTKYSGFTETLAFDPSQIKTKSQLTDIWQAKEKQDE